MKAYKGFDKNMQCRGFQFEAGKTYREDAAVLCKKGFHACTMPLDVLDYYPPGSGSIYREVELEDISGERHSGDTKVCAKTVKIGAELGIPGLVKAQIEWVKKTIGFDDAIEKADKSTTIMQQAIRGLPVQQAIRGLPVQQAQRPLPLAPGLMAEYWAHWDVQSSVWSATTLTAIPIPSSPLPLPL